MPVPIMGVNLLKSRITDSSSRYRAVASKAHSPNIFPSIMIAWDDKSLTTSLPKFVQLLHYILMTLGCPVFGQIARNKNKVRFNLILHAINHHITEFPTFIHQLTVILQEIPPSLSIPHQKVRTHHMRVAEYHNLGLRKRRKGTKNACNKTEPP